MWKKCLRKMTEYGIFLTKSIIGGTHANEGKLILAVMIVVISACAGSDGGDSSLSISSTPDSSAQTPAYTDTALQLVSIGWNKTTTESPTFYLASDIDPSWQATVEDIFESASGILGNYGPFYYLGVGTDISAAEEVVYRFCDLLNVPPDDRFTASNVQHFWDLVRKKPGDAFASMPYGATPPVKIIVQSVEKTEWEKKKIAIHEYVHIYQNSLVLDRQEISPVWIKEASAEFFAQYLAGEKGWNDFANFMKTEMEVVRKMRKNHPDLRLEHIETWDALKSIQNQDNDAAYTLLSRTALWGVAYMVHLSSMCDVYRGYHEDLYELGEQTSFKNNIGLTTEEFYSKFEGFLNLPIEDQLKILPEGDLDSLINP